MSENAPTEEKDEKKKQEHPLVKMKLKLDFYLKELPVLGFNSRKYDLNAGKEFLMPYVIKNEPIQFTIKKQHVHNSL